MNTPTPKLAICLQVSPKDAWLGLRLTRLIASIEQGVRSDIEFIVSARRGTNKPAVDDIRRVASTRFASVQLIEGKRNGTGWPMGCNDLWQETMMRVAQMRDAKKIKADGVLTFEADCLPLRPDWLNKLADEWQLAKSIGKLVCGHAHGWADPSDPTAPLSPPTHINGNAIFHVAVTDKHPELNGCDSRSGWDAYHGKLLLKIGEDTPMIFQKYRIPSATREEVMGYRKEGLIPALFHGIKGETGLMAVESMVQDGVFFERV